MTHISILFLGFKTNVELKKNLYTKTFRKPIFFRVSNICVKSFDLCFSQEVLFLRSCRVIMLEKFSYSHRIRYNQSIRKNPICGRIFQNLRGYKTCVLVTDTLRIYFFRIRNILNLAKSFLQTIECFFADI